MAEHATDRQLTAVVDDAPHDGVRRTRPVVRRPSGPTTRAAVGGLLVTAAAVGVLAALGRDTGPPAIPVVVARQLIEPGDPFDAAAVEVVDLVLPDEVAATTYAGTAALDGTVARSRIEPGELVLGGAVVPASAAQRAAAPSRELALRLEPDRAVGGRIEPGDRVDVLATYGTGASAFTVTVVTDVAVIAVERADGDIGSGSSLLVLLALHHADEALAAAHAADAAAVRIVRTTTAAEGSAPLGDRVPFRPQPPEDGPPATAPDAPDPGQDGP